VDISVSIGTLHLSLLLDSFFRMSLAFVLALPIAREREVHDMSAGLRTFPIVAVGACALILLSRAVLGPSPDAQTHVIQGLVTGVGFIGGGAIIKANDRVHGTATAASIWATAIIGAAVAFGQSEIAIVLAVITFVTLRVVGWLEARKVLAPSTASSSASPSNSEQP
jgi:putative Mg2+ transporter-C (MgtC) family protein